MTVLPKTISYQELRRRLMQFKRLGYTDINCKGIAGILTLEYNYIVKSFLNGDYQKVITIDDLKSLLEAQGYLVFKGDHKGRGFFIKDLYNKRIGMNSTYHSFRECLELIKDHL